MTRKSDKNAPTNGDGFDGATGNALPRDSQDPTGADAGFGASGGSMGRHSEDAATSERTDFERRKKKRFGLTIAEDVKEKGYIKKNKKAHTDSTWTRTWRVGVGVTLSAAAILVIAQWYVSVRSPGEALSTDRVSFVTEETKAYKSLPGEVTPLPPGVPVGGKLLDMSVRANKPISDRFSKIVVASASGTNLEGFTLISGIAGVGKSFMARDYLGDLLVQTPHRSIDLRKMYDDPEMKPNVAKNVDKVGQLAIDAQSNRWFNLMPGLVDQQRKRVGYAQADALLRPLLTPTAERQVTVLDSLDEIHPEDATWVLKLVESVSKSQPSSHFVVLGRPEAFRPFLIDSNGGFARQPAHLVLNAPALDTVADVDTFVRDWEARQGRLRPEVRTKLIQVFSTSALIRSCFASLALTNFCYESLKQQLESGATYDEEALRERVFQNMLERNNDSHGRPSKKVPKDLALYRAVLERIAVKYRDEVTNDGHMPVAYMDTVTVMDGIEQRVFNVADVLDFSGLVDLSPVEAQSRHYRFIPRWLHVHLLKSYQRPHDKGAFLWGTQRLSRQSCLPLRLAA